MNKYEAPKNIKTDDTEQKIYDKVYGRSLDSFWQFILSILFGYK